MNIHHDPNKVEPIKTTLPMRERSQHLKAPGLKYKLEAIRQVLAISELSDLEVTEDYIRNYYRINKIPYSIFHHFGNAVHMGISRDGIFHEADLLAQAETVAQWIDKTSAQTVVELGGGRGINSIWLASKYPNKSFFSIDMSPEQHKIAAKAGRNVKNFTALLVSFNDEKLLNKSRADLMFAVESLCHSPDISLTLAKISSALLNQGYLVCFDGYRGLRDEDVSDPQVRIALSLAEKGMAVQKFSTHASFVAAAQRAGLQLVHSEDLSGNVLPTMRRFEKLARNFFVRPRMARLLASILPSEFIFNAVAGLLLPTLIETRACTYQMTVFSKRAR